MPPIERDAAKRRRADSAEPRGAGLHRAAASEEGRGLGRLQKASRFIGDIAEVEEAAALRITSSRSPCSNEAASVQ